MRGMSFATTISGVSSSQLKLKAAPKGGSSRMVHIAGVEGTSRSPGVKAAKATARGKKPQVEGQDVSDYQPM